MTRVRVRGIYATALTERLRGEFDVVRASPPIRERFDEPFPVEPDDVDVATTDDRIGVGVTGAPPDVAAVVDSIVGAGVDALSWDDPTPVGAVFAGVVEETLRSGAVVDLGEGRRGFLPYGNSDAHVDDGDRLRVQVCDPAPPWIDDRPVLDADVAVEGGLVALSRDGSGVAVDGPGDGRELAGLTDLLSADAPDGWGVRWSRDADDADMDALESALELAGERAATVDDALADAAPPAERAPAALAAPRATTWVRFGRESRFALDEVRAAVTTTMPGHHRVKVGAERASAAVDFAEAVCTPGQDAEFPFGVVARQFGPREGDRVALAHGKPTGDEYDLGPAEVTAVDPEGSVTLRRTMSASGTYDALGTERDRGDVATTTIAEGRWWYPTVYRGEDGASKGTYVNVCTPVEVFPDAIRYVDLHVDVVKRPDGDVERVDDDELDAAVDAGRLPEALADRARSVASGVHGALSE